MTETVRMGAGGRLTIPERIRKELHLEHNDPLLIEVTTEGILLRPSKLADNDQAWFWTPEWQEGEREADAELATGQGETYESDEVFLAALKARQKRADV